MITGEDLKPNSIVLPTLINQVETGSLFISGSSLIEVYKWRRNRSWS